MSDFWLDRIGPAGRPAPAPQDSGTPAAWWNTPTSYTRRPPQQLAHQGEVDLVPMPAPALSARSDEVCPGCGSGNYFRASPSIRPRCYDCNHPGTQSESGSGAVAQRGVPARASVRQAAGGYFPNVMVGHI